MVEGGVVTDEAPVYADDKVGDGGSLTSGEKSHSLPSPVGESGEIGGLIGPTPPLPLGRGRSVVIGLGVL